MSPPEIQAILNELLHRQFSNTWLIAVLALVGAAIGGFFSSYFRRKGEDQAIRENFAEIRQQLKTTTGDTEEIKQYLSGRAWRSQQQWSAREKYYSQLLSHLHHFKSALDDLSDYFIEPGTEYMPDSERGQHFQDLSAKVSDEYNKAESLLGPAALYLTRKSLSALEELFREHWGLANFGAVCTADYVTGAQGLASAAYGEVLKEAKVHLGIDSDA